MIDYFPDDLMVQERHLLKRGQCLVMREAGASIETRSLGSGVAIGVYDPMTSAVALAHICYAHSSLNKRKDASMQGQFADTGVAKLVEELKEKGTDLDTHSCIVTLVGGAHALGPKDTFAVGNEVVDAVRSQLEQHGIQVAAEDVDGHVNRRLAVYSETGDMCVSAHGKHYKLL